jgi:hypothetical protein
MLPQLPHALLFAPARIASFLLAERRTRPEQLREQLRESIVPARVEAAAGASPFRETGDRRAASSIRRNHLEIENEDLRNCPVLEFEALAERLTLVVPILEGVDPANRRLDGERKAFPD